VRPLPLTAAEGVESLKHLVDLLIAILRRPLLSDHAAANRILAFIDHASPVNFHER